MLPSSPENPSSSVYLGSVEDVMSREDLLAAYAVIGYIDRAQQINDRISRPDDYRVSTGVAVVDAINALNNVVLFGINQVRIARAERYVEKAERRLGMSLPTSVYKNDQATDKQ